MLDERDLKILRRMSENARITFTELAKEVNLSDVAVIKRVKRLEGSIVKRYTISVDPRKLGYRIVSFTGIDVEPERLFEVIEKVRNRGYVMGLWLTTGDHQLMTMVWARDEEDMAKIHKELSEINGVKRVCPAIVLKTLKDIEMLFRID
jgi:Lrp/AsnC family transcriptional regulator for asnA, asnC and gidA|uniref:Lrp/AsnC family transcriptional regulator n=1 Tax=Ignisphaera aggregans TaxID=334771 RepID=A0A7J2U5P6_9CREN